MARLQTSPHETENGKRRSKKRKERKRRPREMTSLGTAVVRPHALAKRSPSSPPFCVVEVKNTTAGRWDETGGCTRYTPLVVGGRWGMGKTRRPLSAALEGRRRRRGSGRHWRAVSATLCETAAIPPQKTTTATTGGRVLSAPLFSVGGHDIRRPPLPPSLVSHTRGAGEDAGHSPPTPVLIFATEARQERGQGRSSTPPLPDTMVPA